MADSPDTSDSASSEASADGEEIPEEPTVEDLLDDLDDLEDVVDTPEERLKVREAIRTARRMGQNPSVFGRVIYGFDRADAAEALLGALIFGIPMIVEGGTLEVGAYVAQNPPFLLGTLAVGVGIVIGILYVADFQDVRIARRYFGFIPRRLVGVVGISFLTALVLMTGWGRVSWAQPWLALAQVSVAFVPMAIGAALGDILPGS